MKKFTVGFSLLVLTLAVGIFSYNSFEQPIDIFISPNGKYKVELYGDKRRPWWFTNTVSAKIFSSDEFLVSDELHYADAFDTSFDLTYQKYVWVDDNILSFRGIQNHNVADKNNGDFLVINNKTNQRIKYLKIKFSINLFLVIELEPHSTKTIYVNHSRANEYIYAAGEFANGEKINFKYVNFSETAKEEVNELFKYCVFIEDGKMSINSQQLEGYETYPKIIIPKVENCSK